ncbi:MAG: pantoate--beta-alanine ligase [Vampirovibrio sp.]|nr:pantoate--beta-alanine ligase [Vampirovibrio sp.]
MLPQLQLPVLTTPAEIQAFKAMHPQQTVALVPTMGNLHEGHKSLIRLAKQRADVVIVSIFVNPTQFAPTEDFSQYPRTWEADLLACKSAGASAVLAPNPEALYPMGTPLDHRFSVVPPKKLTHQLCGLNRPTHFEGVATVVLKLFNWVQPNIAVFGEKDAQQLAILRWMVNDFGLPIELIGHPIVRQPDGLALSSRNQYLTTPEAKALALGLSTLLMGVQRFVQQAFTENPTAVISVEKTFQQKWESIAPQLPSSPTISWDYWQAVHRESFDPQAYFSPESLLLVAGKVGDVVRLIDNLALYPPNPNESVVNCS